MIWYSYLTCKRWKSKYLYILISPSIYLHNFKFQHLCQSYILYLQFGFLVGFPYNMLLNAWCQWSKKIFLAPKGYNSSHFQTLVWSYNLNAKLQHHKRIIFTRNQYRYLHVEKLSRLEIHNLQRENKSNIVSI